MQQQMLRTGLSLRNWPVSITYDALLKHIQTTSLSEVVDERLLRESMVFENDLIYLTQSDGPISYVSAAFADFLRYELLNAGTSFSFESVLSHPGKLDFLSEAKQRGCKVYLYFISTEQPSINESRVRVRVGQGGHDVPSQKIRERYHRTMSHVFSAMEIADTSYLFDNSVAHAGKAFQNFAYSKEGKIILLDEQIPSWFDTYVLSHFS